MGGEPDRPPPGPPLVLIVEAPPRGHAAFGPNLLVRGRVEGATAPVVTVAGVPAPVDADGAFSVQVPVQPGLNILITQAEDGARRAEDRRAVLQDADADPFSALSRVVRVHLSQVALATVAALASELAEAQDLQALAAENMPPDVHLDALEYSRIEVLLEPARGVLQATLRVHDLELRVRGGVSFGAEIEVAGTATANPAEVVAEVRIAATPQGGLDIGIERTEVTLHGFDYDIQAVPGLVEDWFADEVRARGEDLVAGALGDFVLPNLFDPAALNRSVEILGRTLNVSLKLDEVLLQPGSMQLVLDANATPGALVHPGGAVRRSPGLEPTMRVGAEVDTAVAADLLSRMLHAAWAGGLLDFDADALEMENPLTVQALALALGEGARDLDPDAPVQMTVRPLLPAVVRMEAGPRPVVVEAGDVMLDFHGPTGLMLTVAVHLIARANVDVRGLDAIELSADLEVEAHADVADTPLGPANERLIEESIRAIAALIPAFLAEQTIAIGPDFIPLPVRVTEPFADVDAAAPFLHLRARLAR
jgi:hypothetical protein